MPGDLSSQPLPKVLQSSSASRFTAGAAGFLTLIQSADRSNRYGEPSRFDTMPSQPSGRCAVALYLIKSGSGGGGQKRYREHYLALLVSDAHSQSRVIVSADA